MTQNVKIPWVLTDTKDNDDLSKSYQVDPTEGIISDQKMGIALIHRGVYVANDVAVLPEKFGVGPSEPVVPSIHVHFQLQSSSSPFSR